MAAVLLGESPEIKEVQRRIEQAALLDVPILILGESGTGKGIAASLLHRLSKRGKGPFVKKNCPAIPSQLFESELFGNEIGAFTGANRARPGVFEQADKGVLFLDEVGELDLGLQAKLLQVLQDFRVTRLGSLDERPIDVRLICATNRDLSREITEGRFRSDLFYRVNVLQITMPPLRRRASDVPILIAHYLSLYSSQFGQHPPPLSKSLMKVLMSYHWPGNVRELENLIKRYVVFGNESSIVSALRNPENTSACPLDGEIDINTPLRIQTKRVMKTMERRIIMNVLQANRWNRRKTARTLDISYRALLYKIKSNGIPSIRRTRTAPDSPEESHESV
ncbi:MAG: sigma-54 dependent transcriptional regulator [Granulicella sp.]